MLSDNLEDIKKSLKQNVIHINNFDDTDALLFSCKRNMYVIFDTIALKNYFINNTQLSVINCNSSYEKFVEDMENFYDEYTLFNNVNFCLDFRILNLIQMTNNTKID